jgi:sporulation protein YlmC with PRC-barrel domain
MFTAPNRFFQNNERSIEVFIKKLVKTMYGTKIGKVTNIHFKDEDGYEIGRIETHYRQVGP